MIEEPTTVITVAEGIARITWVPDLHDEGLMAAVDVVRREVEAALDKHVRVEALVSPDDELAQRVATWSGLRREGVMRGVTVDGTAVDRIVYARLATDLPVHEPEGFRALLNSFLPRKRAISQMLLRDTDQRVLLCQLTYKQDWDLPGGVVINYWLKEKPKEKEKVVLEILSEGKVLRSFSSEKKEKEGDLKEQAARYTAPLGPSDAILLRSSNWRNCIGIMIA